MTRSRTYALDVFRAAAALEVVAGHLRSLLFVDYRDLAHPGLLAKGFYFLTSFGHPSVVIFFVLSGYLVGGPVIAAVPQGFWPGYLIKRFSRLWIVLIPSLLLTLFWNTLGLHGSGQAFLSGRLFPAIAVAPSGSSGVALGWKTFLGNAAFLQTIAVPTYGDNGPLWSLANEFWYYLLFPLLYLGLRGDWRGSPLRSAGQLLIGVGILCLLPAAITQAFPLWLLGAAVAAWARSGRMAFMAHPGAALIALGLFGLTLKAARRDLLPLPDYWTAIEFAGLLPWLIRKGFPGPVLGRVAAWFSDFSYTLYLVHFSFMAFLWYGIFSSHRAPPNAAGVALFGLMLAAATAYAFLVSLLFERRTGAFRRACASVMGVSGPSA